MFTAEPLRMNGAAPSDQQVGGAGSADGASAVETVQSWTQILATGLDTVDDAERVDLLRAIEELKCAAEAAQARASVELDTAVREREATAGVPAERQGRGVANQVALARRCSPFWGRRLVGLAKVVKAELWHTAAAWRAGRISERRVLLIARHTATVPVEVRRQIDAEIAGDPGKLERMSDRQTEAAVAGLAARFDPASVAAKRRKAESERRVSIRPAPDTMSWLSALLPVKDGVAISAALTRVADAARAAGDERSRGQVMADTLVERITGRLASCHHPADETACVENAGVPDTSAPHAGTTGAEVAPDVTVNLVMSDHTLFGGSDAPARVPGYGTVPAELARAMVAGTAATIGETKAARVWVRRLFTDAVGNLVAMESASRLFPAGLAEFITIRDQTCRTPWCDAPVRHIDHITGVADGGETSAVNGQGLCEACNYAKTAPGWKSRPVPDSGSRWAAETVTPTGHRYVTDAESWPKHERTGDSESERSPSDHDLAA